MCHLIFFCSWMLVMDMPKQLTKGYQQIQPI